MKARGAPWILAVSAGLLVAAGVAVLAATKPPYRADTPLREPTLFADGIVSTGEFETHPAFTPDGRTFYFVRSTPQFTDWKIYISTFADGRWSKPQMAPFSGTHRDADPFVTADGRQLYFISDRPVDGKAKTDMDIWVINRSRGGEWGEPRNLAALNSEGNEWLPRLAANGTIYFGSDRPGGSGRTDLYRAPREEAGFLEVENLGPVVNSEADEYEPCIAPDESFIVFMADGRPDSVGAGDLYITYRKDGAWTAPKNLGPTINRPALDIAPYISPDGKYFFFASSRRDPAIPRGERPARSRNGLGDIYQMDLEALHALAK